MLIIVTNSFNAQGREFVGKVFSFKVIIDIYIVQQLTAVAVAATTLNCWTIQFTVILVNY